VANNNPNQQANQASANAAQQQANALNQSRQALTELLQLQRDYATEAGKAAKSVFGNNIQAQETAKAFKDIASASRQFEQNIGDVLSGTKTLASLEKDIANSEKAKNRLLVEARQALNKMNFSQSEITEALRDQNGLYRLIGNTTNSLTDAQTDLLFLYADQQSALEEQSREMQILAERAGNIDDAFGLAGGTAEGLTGILGK
jgi:DNA repair exonuclease SbcCD ATPase subunit